MGFTSGSSPEVLSKNSKLVAHESALQKSLISFKELVSELVQIQNESENYRVKYLSVKEKCENKTCSGVEELRKVVETKDLIIQSVASILTKLNETRNFNILSEAFKVLCEDAVPLTPPIDKSPTNKEAASIDYDDILKENTDVLYKEESLCEIEGTPTGRTSPILNVKKVSKSSDFKDKKKCPDDWPTPESKCVKLLYPTPTRKSGRLTQTRLQLVKAKPTKMVDLAAYALGNDAQAQIKKEPIDNEDTILPSPTSGPTHFTLLKNTSKPSPSKFKKPLGVNVKSEKSPKQDENVDANKRTDDLDMSINILNQLPLRLRNNIKTERAIKPEPIEDDDVTHCDLLSMMTQIDKLEAQHSKENCSTPKRPLAVNMNITNTPPRDVEPSLSILRPEPGGKASVDAVKRKTPELVEPIYKEPTVRNKAEKRQLQGWSCDECENFYGTIYKDDPVMLARKINECSKHRGRHNPARPKTPPNFWNPRWEVPQDTDELNRLNNAT